MNMQNFRMLNRRPLELPALDTAVQMVNVEYRPLSAPQTRDELRTLPHLLYNKYSGWHFFLSNEGIGKMTNEIYDNEVLTPIHLSAVTNLDTLVRIAVLGYSKLEPATRINSHGKEVKGNNRIKANHRFYAGAWIDGKPYSVRMMIREYYDGTVELGEEAKAYALNVKEMRGIVTCPSEFPASHGVTTALGYAPSIKDGMPGISMPSSRCEPTPPTDIRLTQTKLQTLSDFVKVPLQQLVESNLKEGEEPCYQQRAEFDYSKTGTDCLESIFDRLRLTDAQRTALYKGDKILASDVRLHNEKTDVILNLERGELVYKMVNPQTEHRLY